MHDTTPGPFLSLSLSPSFDLGARFQTSLTDIFFFLFLLRESTLFLPFSYIPRYFLSRSYLTYTSASFSISARYVSYRVCFLFPLLRRCLFFSFPLHLRFLLVIYFFPALHFLSSSPSSFVFAQDRVGGRYRYRVDSRSPLGDNYL